MSVLKTRHEPCYGVLATMQKDTLSDLFNRLQDELRVIAKRERRQRRVGDTMSTTALINELYLKLRQANLPAPNDDQHFVALACNTIRQLVVDEARSRLAQKRGGGEINQSLSSLSEADLKADEELARTASEVSDALTVLEGTQARQARVVLLRYFGGLKDLEIGQIMQIDASTVRRDWLKARAWLHQQLSANIGT
jgi:RNA polymerase sigma factor (TIGR02999 family)